MRANLLEHTVLSTQKIYQKLRPFRYDGLRNYFGNNDIFTILPDGKPGVWFSFVEDGVTYFFVTLSWDGNEPSVNASQCSVLAFRYNDEMLRNHWELIDQFDSPWVYEEKEPEKCRKVSIMIRQELKRLASLHDISRMLSRMKSLKAKGEDYFNKAMQESLMESTPLKQGKHLRPNIIKVFSDIGIPPIIPGHFKETDIYRVAEFPDGSSDNAWFFKWDDSQRFGCFVTIETDIDEEKDHIYLYPKILMLIISREDKKYTYHASEYLGMVHGDTLEEVRRSSDAVDLTKKLKKKMRTLSQKKMEDITL